MREGVSLLPALIFVILVVLPRSWRFCARPARLRSKSLGFMMWQGGGIIVIIIYCVHDTTSTEAPLPSHGAIR